MQRMKYGLVCSSMSMSDSSECWEGRGGEGRGGEGRGGEGEGRGGEGRGGEGRGGNLYKIVCLLIFTHLP